MKKLRHALLALCAIFTTTSIHAAYFADSVISYTAGTNANASYQDPTAALGSVSSTTGVGSPFVSVVSPFSPSYDTDQIVQLGKGGQITLHLAATLLVGSGFELGIFTNVGFMDSSYPAGTTGSVASVFSNSSATVEVSFDGTNWVSLGLQNFTTPSNYYNDPIKVGPYDSSAAAAAVTADFGKAFTGSLSDFNGKTSYADVLSVYNGSGGGTWLSLSTTGLSQVNYVRISNAANASANFTLDAVAINNTSVSAAPEPNGLVFVSIGLFGWLSTRRSRKAFNV